MHAVRKKFCPKKRLFAPFAVGTTAPLAPKKWAFATATAISDIIVRFSETIKLKYFSLNLLTNGNRRTIIRVQTVDAEITATMLAQRAYGAES